MKYSNLLKSKEPLIVFVVGFILLLMSKFSLINMPAYWDEMGIYIEPLKHLYDDLGYAAYLRGFHDHPPGLHFLAYPLYKISGASMWSVRIFALLMSSLSILMTYLLALRVGNRFYAITSAATLFLLPTFFARSHFLVGDNTVTGLLLAYLFFSISDRWKWAFVLGLIVGFSRETSIAYGAGVLIYFLLHRKITKWSLIVSAAPALSLGMFFLLQKIFYGTTFQHQAFTAGHFSSSGFYSNILNIIKSSLIGDYFLYLWLMLFGGILVQIYLVFKKNIISNPNLSFIVSLLVIITSYVAGLGFNAGFLNRYLDPSYPLIVILVFYAWQLFLRKWLLLFIPLIALVFTSFYYGNDKNLGDGHVDNMQYVDVVKVYRLASNYIEENHRGKKLFVPWPLNHVFQSPYMGYLDSAFKVECQQPFGKGYRNTEQFDIFVWASNSDVFVVGYKDRFINKEKLTLIKSFELNNKRVEIFRK